MSGIVAVLLTMIMGIAVLLSEAGHSYAHRQLGQVSHHSVEHHGSASHHGSADHHDVAHTAAVAVQDADASNEHPHPDVIAIPPVKTVLHALTVRTVVDLSDQIDQELRLPLVVSSTFTLRGREHGPPSPARAPPLV
jgi:hypothetical protein